MSVRTPTRIGVTLASVALVAALGVLAVRTASPPAAAQGMNLQAPTCNCTDVTTSAGIGRASVCSCTVGGLQCMSSFVSGNPPQTAISCK